MAEEKNKEMAGRREKNTTCRKPGKRKIELGGGEREIQHNIQSQKRER